MHIIQLESIYLRTLFLAPDLVIEQVLMKSIKSSGGLTHGRGMDETQRTRWLQSMPFFAQISEEMKCVQEKSGKK